MTIQQQCLAKMRLIYAEFDPNDIAYAIKVIRAELTAESDRHELQVMILAKQAELENLMSKT